MDELDNHTDACAELPPVESLSEPKDSPMFEPNACTAKEADAGMKGYAAARAEGAE